ncbi:MAG: SagB/ThcOx family dehydrogenase [Desulfarculaceae bacterium]|nr:SagB/ThcOx family dehydrogenase [Desulfarculaceae bacterium]
MNSIEEHRFFLKDTLRKSVDFRQTDQNRGVPVPPLQKPRKPDAKIIPLPARHQWKERIDRKDLLSAISERRSQRRFLAENLTLDELAFLLWATQGISDPSGKNPSLRTVPSAGARHSFETYLFVRRVSDLAPGLYRFLPVENALLFVSPVEHMADELTMACFGQRHAGSGAATFVWSCIPYRMEWRYSLCAHRVILLDAGHVCQNLYLACRAVDAGTCAIGAYDQEKIDTLLGVDGEEEFAVYLAPVGKV